MALTKDGAWHWTPAPADPAGGGLTSVSCPSTDFCVAVDDVGHALRWNGSGWSAAVRVDRSALTAVSCEDTSSCVAVDARGDAVRWNDARWSAPGRAAAAGLTGVSCASATVCAAVAGNGDAVLTRDGARRWTPVLADPVGGGLTAVSCFTDGCVAVDFAGRALSLSPARHPGT